MAKTATRRRVPTRSVPRDTTGTAAEELGHEHPPIKERLREGALGQHDRHATEAELIQAAADGKTFSNEQLDHVSSPVGLPADTPNTESEGKAGFKRKEANASKAAAKKKSPEAAAAKPLKAAKPPKRGLASRVLGRR